MTDKITDQPEAPAQDQWQPIEKAPINGEPIIGAWQRLNKTWDMNILFWFFEDGEGNWYDMNANNIHGPTHWMPLPEPPAPDGAQVETVTLYGRRRLFWTVQNEIDTHRLTLPADMKPRVYTAPDGAQVIVERIDDE